jgi:type IV secretion system protein TrbL
MDTLNGVVAQFNVASTHYAAAIQPFALKLFVGLLFIDILVTALQFGLDQGDAAHYLGRLFKHVLSGGFIYLMIINAFPWMGYVLQSFSRVGTSVSGMPHLDPGTVLQVGGNMAQTIFDSPASAGLMPNIELAIVESVSAFIVLLSFVIAAAVLTLTLIESYLVIGGAVMLLGFGGSRWTASIAEGYFSYVIRVGTRLLFFYLVLGIGIQIATQWQAAILAACHPVSTALPWFTTYGVPPKSIMTTVCSNVVPVHAMLNLTAMSIIFLIITLAVPYTAASIVSGTVGLALSNAFEAAYVAQTIVRPITSALQTGFNKVAQIGNGSGDTNGAATGWVKSMDFGRQTQQLANLGSDGGQRVPTRKDVRGTSVMPSRAPNTTPINPGTARYGNGDGTTTVGKATSKT